MSLPDAVAALMLDLELTDEERDGINPFELDNLEYPGLMHPCPVWAEHKAVLVPHFIRRNPGRRPSRWWLYDAPRQPLGTYPGWWIDGRVEEPRRRLGGTGMVAWEALNVGIAYHCGIPSAWVDAEDAEWLTAEGIAAVPIDPADPPRFESQAAYLRRHGLFMRGEERRLTPTDFEPEEVQPRNSCETLI